MCNQKILNDYIKNVLDGMSVLLRKVRWYCEFLLIGHNLFSKVWRINWIFAGTCTLYWYWEIVVDKEYKILTRIHRMYIHAHITSELHRFRCLSISDIKIIMHLLLVSIRVCVLPPSFCSYICDTLRMYE